MGKIINIKEKINRDNGLISSRPWEFRKGEWNNKFFIQVLSSHWHELEKQGKKHEIPPIHNVILDSLSHTIYAMYSYRENAEKMKELYYLAGLIDCMINQINPILRTDHINEMYKKIKTFKEILGVNWYGQMNQVLFPIEKELFNINKYRFRLHEAETMKELYDYIKEGTCEMFDILSSEYIFFTPDEVVRHGK
jgi:hypothetical protein